MLKDKRTQPVKRKYKERFDMTIKHPIISPNIHIRSVYYRPNEINDFVLALCKLRHELGFYSDFFLKFAA